MEGHAQYVARQTAIFVQLTTLHVIPAHQDITGMEALVHHALRDAQHALLALKVPVLSANQATIYILILALQLVPMDME